MSLSDLDKVFTLCNSLHNLSMSNSASSKVLSFIFFFLFFSLFFFLSHLSLLFLSSSS